MTMTDDNPRAVRGDNQPPDWAKDVTERMAMDYRLYVETTQRLLEEARALPREVDESNVSIFASTIVKLRGHAANMKALHTAEKEPYLRAGEAVDQFFFGQIDKVARRNRTNNPGAADVLQSRVDDHVRRKAEVERQARIAAEIAARDAERKAREERERLEREATKAQEKADRARKRENKEAHQQAAEAARLAAGTAQAEEDVARGNAQDARAAAVAPTADLVRQRTDEGNLVTAKNEPFVEIVDRTKLDFEKLKPFFKDDHVLQALKAWARTTQHRQQMPGCIVELRDRAVIR